MVFSALSFEYHISTILYYLFSNNQYLSKKIRFEKRNGLSNLIDTFLTIYFSADPEYWL